MATQNGNYDFDAFNRATENIGSGLALHLAIQMLRKVHYVMFNYDNPLADDLNTAISELKEIQAQGKAQAAKRAKDHAE